ncbi:hypothetical protein CI102_12644 [Trichoderma harzianum]|nr:hypothetical protein CI102_12644 [Trichoderma harzianum]
MSQTLCNTATVRAEHLYERSDQRRIILGQICTHQVLATWTSSIENVLIMSTHIHTYTCRHPPLPQTFVVCFNISLAQASWHPHSQAWYASAEQKGQHKLFPSPEVQALPKDNKTRRPVAWTRRSRPNESGWRAKRSRHSFYSLTTLFWNLPKQTTSFLRIYRSRHPF